MNPWRQNLLATLRSILRFALWVGIVLNGIMLAIFSVAFVAQFLLHLWSWCCRVLFSEDW